MNKRLEKIRESMGISFIDTCDLVAELEAEIEALKKKVVALQDQVNMHESDKKWDNIEYSPNGKIFGPG